MTDTKAASGTGACEFCPPPDENVFLSEHLVVGLWDKFPVTPGHALLIPRRHVPGWLDVSEEERRELMNAVSKVVNEIEARHGPVDAFNVGVNSGAAAGQTVCHLHVHVIPRRHGDVSDPSGGIRHVIPGKGNYVEVSASEAGSSVGDGLPATISYPSDVRVEPDASSQVEFLTRVQHLLNAGLFSATYKYALLLALADVAVEKGDDTIDELVIPVVVLAHKFIDYYWDQCRPFETTRGQIGGRLRQNTGAQAKVLSVLTEMHDEYTGRLSWLKRDRSKWRRLVREVSRVVCGMPLWKLQTVGGESQDFLYPSLKRGDTITLRPGVAFCLRRFHDLIGNLVRGAWIEWVRRQNRDVTGDVADLTEFLFGAQRQRLRAIAPVLFEMQGGRCFYSQERIVRPDAGDVDHFIPFARYPHDYGHNLVLSSKTANASKRDYIAAEHHLEHWIARNEVGGSEFVTQCNVADIPADFARTLSIVKWAYEQADHAATPVWLKGREPVERLTGKWRELLAPA